MIRSVKYAVKRTLARFPFFDGIFRRFIWSKIAFPEIEMEFLSKMDPSSINVSVDIGAALGGYSWILQGKSKKVFAFEPGSVHFDYLRRINFLSNIELVNCAVGAVAEEKLMYTAGSDDTALHTATLSESNPISGASNVVQTRVKQITLDSFFERQISEGDSIDFIKIDVEGYELEVLAGARRLLSTFYPLVICEIESRHNDRYEEVFNFMFALGYVCEYFAGGKFNDLGGPEIRDLQKTQDLSVRLDGEVAAVNNRYINNFIFTHQKSPLRLTK